MNRLYWCEILPELPIPNFSEALRAHISAKKHPAAHAASLSAWNLLAHALQSNGHSQLPQVAFTSTEKPYFIDFPLHFSLAHSENIAAVLLSSAPCAVDVEMLRPTIEYRLFDRCMHPHEAESGCDFFDVWTKKECIVKLYGSGLPSHPSNINTLAIDHPFLTRRITDSAGNAYALSALYTSGEAPEITRICLQP